MQSSPHPPALTSAPRFTNAAAHSKHYLETGLQILCQWLYIELQGKNNQCFILLLGYWVCESQTINMGLNNTFNQQYQILHQGQQNPDP